VRFFIRLNQQSATDASEVGNIGSDGILSAKLESRKFAITQKSAQQSFGSHIGLL
jgi:hypothetical protein